MSNLDCKAIETPGKYVTDNTLCITSTFGNRYTCLIDVGGPVVTLPSPGAWTVVGINSYTKDCATNGLKTRVAAFRAWIDTYMK
ncbi:transmembrane protease serine 11B-like [Daphnia pulex]|uniref:transmembrane protease serine 11B-like n=1 Tax=Daphnia pulex TaxID=6669 RepID=UPI001EDD9DB5|nr:transmembrane protease serine 11B-like [Daphnia pulex]